MSFTYERRKRSSDGNRVISSLATTHLSPVATQSFASCLLRVVPDAALLLPILARPTVRSFRSGRKFS